MEAPDQFNGYQTDFLGPESIVGLPRLSPDLQKHAAPVRGESGNVLRYQNFSLVQHAQRRFPIYTASNIDGNQFRRLPRHDDWQTDPRIDKKHQWGSNLYSAEKSDFDKGHMTKREDAQWGSTDEEATRGALSTFYYTNAVPQVAKLNQQLWRGLEDYILKGQTVGKKMKISMFTGPVLSKSDPFFVTRVEDQQIRIPTLFWKVIFFTKSDGQLYKVGFLMGQEELLEQMEIVEPRQRGKGLFATEEERLFMDFKKADIYQVNISTIEKLTGLTFEEAIEPFRDDRSLPLVRKEVQARGIFGETEVEIEGLTL